MCLHYLFDVNIYVWQLTKYTLYRPIQQDNKDILGPNYGPRKKGLLFIVNVAMGCLEASHNIVPPTYLEQSALPHLSHLRCFQKIRVYMQEAAHLVALMPRVKYTALNLLLYHIPCLADGI